jgi:hypothetical protein
MPTTRSANRITGSPEILLFPPKCTQKRDGGQLTCKSHTRIKPSSQPVTITDSNRETDKDKISVECAFITRRSSVISDGSLWNCADGTSRRYINCACHTTSSYTPHHTRANYDPTIQKQRDDPGTQGTCQTSTRSTTTDEMLASSTYETAVTSFSCIVSTFFMTVPLLKFNTASSPLWETTHADPHNHWGSATETKTNYTQHSPDTRQ